MTLDIQKPLNEIINLAQDIQLKICFGFGDLFQLPPVCVKAIFTVGWVITKNWSNKDTLDKSTILTI